MSYMERIKAAAGTTTHEGSTVPAPSNVVQLREDIHPYAQAIRERWINRLDDLPRPWVKGAAWDTNCFVTARKLIELANSPWSGYTHTAAREDYMSHAPHDHVWDKREKCWQQAQEHSGGTALPEPPPGAPMPEVTTMDDDTAISLDPAMMLNPIIDWHELFSLDDEGEEWIVEPLLPARRMVALYSAPKAGKSLLMLEIAVAIARGGEVLGSVVEEPARVLYVDFENDPRGDIRSRLEAMEVGPGDLDNLCYLTFPSLAKFDTPQGAGDLLRHVEHYGCTVVVIDTVSRAVAGEENENDTWLAFYRNTGLALKRAGVACIRLDHSGKDREKGMRGGSAKYGDVDAVWRLTLLNEDTINLECTDHRMPIPTKSLTLTREDYPLRHRFVGDSWHAVSDAKARQVDERLDALGVPASASVREAGKALREAGEKVSQGVLAEAVRFRKNRLDMPPTTVPVTPPEHPGTPGGSVPGTPPPRGASGTPPAPVPERPGTAPDELVTCTSCFKPTSTAVAGGNGGRCATCRRDAGEAPEEN